MMIAMTLRDKLTWAPKVCHEIGDDRRMIPDAHEWLVTGILIRTCAACGTPCTAAPVTFGIRLFQCLKRMENHWLGAKTYG